MPLAFDLATYSTTVAMGEQLRQLQLLRNLDKFTLSKTMTPLIYRHVCEFPFRARHYKELNKDKLVLPEGKQSNKVWHEKQPNQEEKALSLKQVRGHRYPFTSLLISPCTLFSLVTDQMFSLPYS